MKITKSQDKKVQELVKSMEGTTHTFEITMEGENVVVIESFNSELPHYNGRKDKYIFNRRGGFTLQSWIR